MLKFLVGFLIVFASFQSQAAGLSKELEDAVKEKCSDGCAVLSAVEIEQMNATISALLNDAYEKGRKAEKGSCRKLGNET